MRQEFRPRTANCRNKEGEIIAGKRILLNRWKEHFELLLNVDNESDAETDEQIDREIHGNPDEEPPTLQEIEVAIMKQRDNRAPGPDNINIELLKQDKPELTARLHKIIHIVWLQENLPKDWTEGAIVPIRREIRWNALTI
ncbi:hypothetical protein ANN_08664 [Periplaneta americana]|uniref:Reverse transcriptase n=1 Tax=Periplaneta americana TaxID=6978 RepID=A0ABQ8T3I0_PERAM|nr:hypothetical protein ANN_08664 [Periplaneta americana]